jgi:hypothetical protein
MVRTNTVAERRNADGTVDYVADLGNVLYNNRVISIGKVVVPIRRQAIFSLPTEKGYYAVVNVYYEVETGRLVYDRVALSQNFISSATAQVLPNLIPVAQFVVQQSLGGLIVAKVNEYSRMSCFTISDGGDTGEPGLQGPLGPTGWQGHSGSEGWTGVEGWQGVTGSGSATGVGATGPQGVRGVTGLYPDLNLLMYMKFKSDSDVQTDYSAYARDCTWTATGIGVTGSDEVSSFSTEMGIIDNCHSVVYAGDNSSYQHNDYVDFSGYTGVLQAWVRVDIKPEADFYYTGVNGVTGVLRFSERCSYFPETFAWALDGTQVSTSEIVTTVVSTGEHLMRLRATNVSGYMDKTKLIVQP